MELIVGAALIIVIVAWCFVRSKAQAHQTVARRPTTNRQPTPSALHTDLPSKNTSPSEPTSTFELEQAPPYAEIADPRGGVRNISAHEVNTYFEPVRKKLASLRKVAANSTRTAQAFRQNGGATPDVGKYRQAHEDAIALTAETERLLDTILFESDSSSIRYSDLLESVIDVELQLEENLTDIGDIEAGISSRNSSADDPLSALRHRAQQDRT